eukprot:995766_1
MVAPIMVNTQTLMADKEAPTVVGTQTLMADKGGPTVVGTQTLMADKEAPTVVGTQTPMADEGGPTVAGTLPLFITNIGTRDVALTTEAKDQATIISIYTTMLTNAFVRASVTAWGRLAMAMSSPTVVGGVKCGRSLSRRWHMSMVVIATKSIS